MLRLLALALCDVATGVLALAGFIKLFDPAPWVSSVRGLGVRLRPGGPWTSVARLVGIVEIGIATTVLLVGGALPFVLLAAAYVAFAVVAALAWRSGGSGSASCGCFGARSAPFSGIHVALDAGAAVVAAVVVLDEPASLVSRLDQGVGASLAYVVFAVFGVAAAVTTMTTGAELVALRKQVADRPAPRVRPAR